MNVKDILLHSITISNELRNAIEILEDIWIQFSIEREGELCNAGISVLEDVEEYLRKWDRIDEKGLLKK